MALTRDRHELAKAIAEILQREDEEIQIEWPNIERPTAFVATHDGVRHVIKVQPQ